MCWFRCIIVVIIGLEVLYMIRVRIDGFVIEVSFFNVFNMDGDFCASQYRELMRFLKETILSLNEGHASISIIRDELWSVL